MKPKFRFPLLSRLLLVALSLGAALSASADTAIVAVPIMITSPGRYFLTSNLSTNNNSKSAITVDADDVVIDFQDHSLTSMVGQGTQANGIVVNNRRNVTIKNGTIAGYKTAIIIQRGINSNQNNKNNVVMNMRLWGNWFAGITIEGGHGCKVEDCVINQTGGTYTGIDAFAINLQFATATVRHNQISNVFAVSGTSHGIISNNSVAFLVGNRIDTVVNGITVTGNTGETKFQKTLTSNVPRPYNGGTDAGDNF